MANNSNNKFIVASGVASGSASGAASGNRKFITASKNFTRDESYTVRRREDVYSRIRKLYDDYANDAAERAKFALGAESKYDEYDKYQAPGLRFSSDRFKDEATEIKSYIEKNRQYLSDEDYSSAMESVNRFMDTDFTKDDNSFNDLYEAVQYYGGYDKYSEAEEEYQKQQTALKKAGLNKNSTYAQIEGVVNDTSMDAGAGPLEQAQGRVYKDRRLSSEEKDYLSSLLKTEEKVATMTDDEILARITRAQNADKNFTPEAFEKDVNDLYTELFSGDSSDFENFTWWKSYEESVANGVSPYDENGKATEDEKKAEKYRAYFSGKYGISDPLGDARMQIENKITSGRNAGDVAYYYTGEDGNATSMTWENLYYERKVGNAYKSVTDEKSDNYNTEAAEIYNRLRELDNEKVNLDATRDEEAVNNWISENDTLKKQFEELTGTTFDAVEYYNVRVKSKERSEKFKNTIESAMQYVNDLPDWANAVIGAATGNPVQLTTNAVKAVSGAVDKDGWVYNAADVADTVAQAAFMYPSVEGAAMVLAIPGAILSGGEYIGDLVASIGHTDATDPNTYRPINIYDDYARMSNETLIGTASGNIQDKLREYGWSEGAVRLATDVYGGVASGLNSIVVVGGSCALFGPAVGQVVASVILSGSAASSATAEAVQNGSTTGEALTYGFLAGCAEYIGEKISLGYFFDNIVNGTMSYKGLRNIMKSLGKTLLGGVVEGSEEVFTDFMCRLADYAVNADHSQLENAKQMYMRQGLSEEEAKEAAIKDWWKQVGSDFIGGFVGGLLMSGASFGANTVISAGQSIQERKIKESLGRALLDSEYEDEQGAKTNAEQTEENSDGTPGEKKISGAEKALRTANEVLAEGSPYREDAELVQLAERVIELSKKGKLSSKNKAAARLIAEFTAKGNAVEEKLLTEEFDKSAARNEKAVQGDGTAESAAANSQQEKYIAPAGRDSSRVSIDDGKIIYVSGKQGGESESMDLAMSLALTSAAEARDAFGIISPRAVQEIGDAYMGDISGMEEYAEQALMAYAMGYMGNSLEDTVATVSDMKSGARQTAWEQGVKDADAFYNERDAEIRSTTAEAQKLGVFTNRQGNTDTSEIQHLIDGKALSEEQTRFIDTVRKLSEVFGLDFEFYASEVDENGQRHGDAGYIDDSGKIHIDIFAGQEKSAFIARDSTLTSTLLHELTHFIHDWSPKAWKEMYNYVVARYSPYGSVQAALEAIRAREELEGRDENEITDDFLRDEFMAQCCEALFEDEAGIRDFAAKYKNTAQKIVEWLENVLEKISGINMGHSESDIAAVISQWQDGIEELREKWLLALEDAANNKNAAEGVLTGEGTKPKNNTIRYKSRKGEIKLASQLTENDLRDLLEKIENGELNKKTYVPLRRNTPQFYIDVVTEYSNYIGNKVTVLNVPIASKVEHLFQNMEEEDGATYGEGKTPHGLSIDDIVEISKQMGHPQYIVLQENGRYAEVVSFFSEKRRKQVIVSIDFAQIKKSNDETGKNYKYSENMNGYDSGYYNIIVTEYEPSNIDSYLSKNKIVYDKKKMNGKYQVGSGRIVTITHDNPFIYKDDTTSESNSQEENGNNSSTEIDSKRRSRSKRDEKSAAAAEAEAKAGEISEKWGLSGKKTEALERGLTNIFESVSGAEVDMAFVRQQASSLAAKTANGMISPDMPTDISDKLKFLRSFGAVSLTEEQRNAAAKLAGTFKEYRSRISSAVKINEKGEALSTAWEKLSKQMPELFPADTAESDMARVMLRNVSRLLAEERFYRADETEIAQAKSSIEEEIINAAKQFTPSQSSETASDSIAINSHIPRPTVRSVLDAASMKTARNEEEREALKQYKLNLDVIKDVEAERDREYSKLLKMIKKDGKSTFTEAEIEKQRKVVEKLENSLKNAERVQKKATLKEPLQQLAERLIKAQVKLGETAREMSREEAAKLREKYKQRDAMEKLRRIMDRARRSVVNPNSKNYILGQFVEPMEKLIEAVDPSPVMFDRDGEKTKTWEDYDRNRRTCLEQLKVMKEILGREKERAKKQDAEKEAARKAGKKANDKAGTSEEIPGTLRTAVDEAYSSVESLADLINDKALTEMSSAELQEIYKRVRDIMNIMRSAERQVGIFKDRTHYEIASELINEAKQFKESDKSKYLSMFTNYLNPIRLVERFAGYNENSYWLQYINSLKDGYDKSQDWYMRCDRPFDKLRADSKNYIKFHRKIVDSGLVDTNGKAVMTTEDMMCSIYLAIERELHSDGVNIHIKDENGGLVIPDARLLLKAKTEADFKKALNTDHAQRIVFKFKAGSEQGNVTEADRLAAFTQSQDEWLRQMQATLKSNISEYGMQWIDAAHQFFNVESKDAINATMLRTGHGIAADEDYYYPMTVSKNFVTVQLDGIEYDATLLGAGFLKRLIPKAKQPLVMSGVENVVKKHMDYVSKIYGLTVPLMDFKNAYNVTVLATDDHPSTSVQDSLDNDVSSKFKKVIEQLMEDLQSRRREKSDTEVGKMLLSTWVGSVLSGNISVTMKQFASYFTAGDVVSGTALTKAFKKFPHYLAHCQQVYDEIDAHTSLHWQRRRGMSIPELQSINRTISRFMDRTRMPQGLRNKIDPTKWIQAVDVGTTALIWEACKIDIESRGIEVGTEEYWDAVTALYKKALEETQPMYDPLHRPEILKEVGAKGMMKQAVYMFKTQPLQNFGVMYSSVNRLDVARTEYKAAIKKGDEAAIKAAKEKVVGARNQLLRSVASQTASLAVFSAMTLLAAAIRGKLDPWRDDDDELTARSILERYGIDVLNNAFANYVPFFLIQTFAPIAESVFKLFIKGEKFSFDEINFPGLQYANDIIGEFGDAINKAADIPEKGFEPFMESIGYLSLKVAECFGIPATNLKNLFYGIGSNINGLFTDGWDWQNEKDEYNTASGVKKALNAGKEEKAAERADAYIDSRVEAAMSDGESEITEEKAREDAEKALRSSVAGSYKEGYKGSYIEAIFDEDETAAAEIEDTLEGLGIGFDEAIFSDWRQQAEDAMLEYDSYDDYVKGKGKLKYTVSGVKSAIDTGKTDEAKKRFNEAVEKKLRDIQKKDSKISSSKAKKQAETEVRNSVGSSYKAEWIKLMWQGYYEEADEIQRKLRKVAGVFDNEYFRGWNQKLKELKKEYSSYEEYEASK